LSWRNAPSRKKEHDRAKRHTPPTLLGAATVMVRVIPYSVQEKIVKGFVKT
jgi:hypothetical protein